MLKNIKLKIERINQNILIRINLISQGLKFSVSEIRILNWLKNFKESEYEMALTILEKLKYYTTSEIIFEFNENLKTLLHYKPDDRKIFVTGLGEFGKSGSSLIYYFKKSPAYKRDETKFKILKHLKKLNNQGLKDGDYLILIDDIIGTGESLNKFYHHEIHQQLVKYNLKPKIIVLCVAYMQNCVELLEAKIPRFSIYGTPYIKAFASGSSVFGYRPKMLPLREFAHKYGDDLFEIYNRDTKKVEKHPLGFNNSQSLIIFPHSVPNNTLPIFWSNKNKWYPLFPRSAEAKLSSLKDFRQENIHWFNAAKSLKIFKDEEELDFNHRLFFNNMDYRILAVIRLKRRRSIDPIICQILNISINELNEIYMEGQKRYFFDDKKELTEKAFKIYQLVLKKVKITNSKKNRKSYNIESKKYYIPTKFLGWS